jgi:dUTP pyrophosphatase
LKPRLLIPIKRLPGTEDIPLPSYESAGASGLDLRAALISTVRLEPGQIFVVPCGFSVAVPSGYEAQLRPRSGLAANSGITVVNAPGTIDADYRGEVCVALINLGKEQFEITRGLRVAQMVIAPVEKIDWDEIETLDLTKRNSGGFGHTGT